MEIVLTSLAFGILLGCAAGYFFTILIVFLLTASTIIGLYLLHRNTKEPGCDVKFVGLVEVAGLAFLIFMWVAVLIFHVDLKSIDWSWLASNLKNFVFR